MDLSAYLGKKRVGGVGSLQGVGVGSAVQLPTGNELQDQILGQASQNPYYKDFYHGPATPSVTTAPIDPSRYQSISYQMYEGMPEASLYASRNAQIASGTDGAATAERVRLAEQASGSSTVYNTQALQQDMYYNPGDGSQTDSERLARLESYAQYGLPPDLEIQRQALIDAGVTPSSQYFNIAAQSYVPTVLSSSQSHLRVTEFGNFVEKRKGGNKPWVRRAERLGHERTGIVGRRVDGKSFRVPRQFKGSRG